MTTLHVTVGVVASLTPRLQPSDRRGPYFPAGTSGCCIWVWEHDANEDGFEQLLADLSQREMTPEKFVERYRGAVTEQEKSVLPPTNLQVQAVMQFPRGRPALDGEPDR